MKNGPIVIFGGAGFAGATLAHRLLEGGESVRIFDDLSRPRVDRNVEWLRDLHDRGFEVWPGDMRDLDAVDEAMAEASAVYHFSNRVATPTRLVDPLYDFAVDLRGTLNVLEAARKRREPLPLIFTATNMAAASSGHADQYVLGYAKRFGLRALFLSANNVYGPRQLGNEDEGWVAHLVKRSLACEPIAIYGNGQQVRDLLFIDDLVDALLLARQHVGELSGQAFLLGGGAANSASVLEIIDLLEELSGEKADLIFCDERPGEPRYFVTDARRFAAKTGWSAKTTVREGLRELHLWLSFPHEKRRPFPVAVRSAS
jgi:CDP-paratose 2-epimerase